MAKSSIDPNLLITVGAVALGGFVIYKFFSDSGIKATTQGVGDIVGGIGQASQGLGQGITDASLGLGAGIADASTGLGAGIGSVGDFVASIFDTSASGYKALGTALTTKKLPAQPYTGGISTQQVINQGGVYGLSGKDIVVNTIAQSQNIRNTTSAKSVKAPALYDAKSGIGVNSAGYGYSSATNLGSKGTGTGITQSLPFGKSYI